jgi:hypothetical protein
MATKQDIAAAVAAIDKALSPEPLGVMTRISAAWRAWRGGPPASPRIADIKAEITAVARYLMLERPNDQPAGLAALETLAMRFGRDVYDSDEWGDHETPLQLDEDQLDLALSRARFGHVDDALHHLQRALPEGYGEIADRLAHVFRSAR